MALESAALCLWKMFISYSFFEYNPLKYFCGENNAAYVFPNKNVSATENTSVG